MSALAFQNLLVEISKAPSISRELHWFKLTESPTFIQANLGMIWECWTAAISCIASMWKWGAVVYDRPLGGGGRGCGERRGGKSPGLKCDLSIRGHQKVISDFIRYQPTQLPLRAHIAVTYRSHSFPCVSQSLWAQGHQLEERKIVWDLELDFFSWVRTHSQKYVYWVITGIIHPV